MFKRPTVEFIHPPGVVDEIMSTLKLMALKSAVCSVNWNVPGIQLAVPRLPPVGEFCACMGKHWFELS